jgi:hypothetical protein
MLDAADDILTQPFMPYGFGVAPDIGVLLGLARLNVTDVDLQFLSPDQQLSTDTFRAVAHQEVWQEGWANGARSPYVKPLRNVTIKRLAHPKRPASQRNTDPASCHRRLGHLAA